MIDAESDLIERSEVLKQLRLNHKDVVYIDKNECARRIEAIPSARPKGKNLREEYPSLFECSHCGARCNDTIPWDCDINFCPNCGADMREREGE